MTEDEFWDIITNSRKGWKAADLEANRERQLARLQRLLKPLAKDRLIAFERQFRAFHEAAYHWDIWEAAYWFAGGCSDDGFHYFRYWLISMGRKVYEAALANPDSLVDVFVGLNDEDVEFEEFGYVCGDIYEGRFGRYMSQEELYPASNSAISILTEANNNQAFTSKPAGKPYSQGFDENDEEFALRMPRLYAWLKARAAKYEAGQEQP